MPLAATQAHRHKDMQSVHAMAADATGAVLVDMHILKFVCVYACMLVHTGNCTYMHAYTQTLHVYMNMHAHA
jgi:hypothetical protein